MRPPVRNISSSFVLGCFLVASATLGAAFGTSGCGGNGGSGTGGAGGTVDPATVCFDYSTFDPESLVAVSFKTDVLPILQRSCGLSTSCHGDASAPKKAQPYLGPNKNTTATPDDITKILAGTVGVKSVADPMMDVIKVGDPEHSFLMYKIDGQTLCEKLSCAATDDCGTIMPQGYKEPMDESERMRIRYWIAQGAANN